MNDLVSETENFKKLPGVVSLRRVGFVTDGLMENKLPDDKRTPVFVRRSGWRGTQNVAQGTVKEKRPSSQKSPEADTVKAFGSREVSNVMVTDTAHLDKDATGMIIRYGLSYSDLAHAPYAFAAASSKTGDKDSTLVLRYKKSLERFIERAKASEGLELVAMRYGNYSGWGVNAPRSTSNGF